MKILSIDGGGIKGLFSAALISGLEQRFKTQVADCFDLLAGTSTGGILALALAARIPAKDIVAFYRDWGPKVFPRSLFGLRAVRSCLVSKYSNEILKKALKNVFGELKIKDIYKNGEGVAVCVPAINATTGSPRVFKTSHHPDLTSDDEYHLWEIALSTSASPTFFPLAETNIPDSKSKNLYVDGGLWANNPSLVALSEALTYGKTPISDTFLLSVGNIVSCTSFKSNTILSRGLVLWREKILSLTFEAQSSAIHHQIRLLYSSMGIPSHYARIEQVLPGKSHDCLKSLDCATETNLNDLEAYGIAKSNYEGVKPEIVTFFKERK